MPLLSIIMKSDRTFVSCKSLRLIKFGLKLNYFFMKKVFELDTAFIIFNRPWSIHLYTSLCSRTNTARVCSINHIINQTIKAFADGVAIFVFEKPMLLNV